MTDEDKHTSRRDVLELTGVGIGAAIGISMTGTVAARVPCTGCDGGGGGGSGSGSPPPTPQTGPYTVDNGEVELTGWAYGTDVEAWFEWGPEGDGFPYDTELRLIDDNASFTGHPVGEESGITYEYRAVAYNDYGRTEGATRTFSF
ncbi:hypothetical protein [Haladaptatus paucihalophilus]|uniref:Fibronectin type-III domain-containing protein n=1 Tax=Haladaptatus paucihalophilus DX253 TaxID=797209 RepID=A0A1M6VRJ1_HALPU|nr:hypothetical protein [Haladaptatus paucihalophilus]SHK84100.1 hypothetical protein SAMN05444342_2361 [Haladaptatus paucihalophilus DX253]